MQMFPVPLVIRAPLPSDATAMAHLFTQLGYAAEADELLPRLLGHDVATRVLLAEQAERVVGVLVWHWLQPLHVAPAWGLISALVVDDGARGGGIGAALLCEAERQAREAGCSQLELSSSIKREDAHRFYLAQAYQERPKRFVKLL
ncbi:GNAT family N-acetyltransferase [Aeromonas jandaei]|uniref:GNAT family N-acetyltransferase n=1 Tax=Aeromonas jandaei TaxID=650 RepID=A0ABD7EPY5_AERJA|nr:GNAT family N-acetyltransferase [Aeromonas jandaei]MBL0597071.1 GNAT family N-acetyltransferase [Aeromonas jandaei]QWL63088.1 GNAT family N-acetyltransferase [Aeromonas jandaei]